MPGGHCSGALSSCRGGCTLNPAVKSLFLIDLSGYQASSLDSTTSGSAPPITTSCPSGSAERSRATSDFFAGLEASYAPTLKDLC